MKIRFIKGTTLAGGTPVNPGEIHDVNDEDARRFVNFWKDAEIYTPAMETAAKAEAAPVEAPKEKSEKGKK